MSIGGPPSEKVELALTLPQSLVDDLEVAWKESDYNSRNEYVRSLLQDSLAGED